MPNKPFFTVQDIEDSLNPSIKQSFNIRTFVCCIQALLFSSMPHMNSKNNQEELFLESIAHPNCSYAYNTAP